VIVEWNTRDSGPLRAHYRGLTARTRTLIYTRSAWPPRSQSKLARFSRANEAAIRSSASLKLRRAGDPTINSSASSWATAWIRARTRICVWRSLSTSTAAPHDAGEPTEARKGKAGRGREPLQRRLAVVREHLGARIYHALAMYDLPGIAKGSRTL
jgi:hypothetical protein